jgi:hypothetical protein
MCWCQGCPECLGRGVRIRFQIITPKGVVVGILHKSHIFHFFAGDGVDDGVCLVLPRPMVVSKGDCHVIGVHFAEVVLVQATGRESL